MAYMRGEYYVWSDGNNLHINELEVPNEVFEELAAMYFLRLSEEDQQKAIERAYENHGGNFGCEGVAKYLGKPSGYEMLEAELKSKTTASLITADDGPDYDADLTDDEEK